ncbi:LAFA_0B08438g1_1 [Lachancea sp. 'fantastica']|nr:LAFA_0B08438g1_1 [Lachancea sp. 'fantastica']
MCVNCVNCGVEPKPVGFILWSVVLFQNGRLKKGLWERSKFKKRELSTRECVCRLYSTLSTRECVCRVYSSLSTCARERLSTREGVCRVYSSSQARACVTSISWNQDSSAKVGVCMLHQVYRNAWFSARILIRQLNTENNFGALGTRSCTSGN